QLASQRDGWRDEKECPSLRASHARTRCVRLRGEGAVSAHVSAPALIPAEYVVRGDSRSDVLRGVLCPIEPLVARRDTDLQVFVEEGYGRRRDGVGVEAAPVETQRGGVEGNPRSARESLRGAIRTGGSDVARGERISRHGGCTERR